MEVAQAPAPAVLEVRLLGRIGASVDGREIHLSGRQAQALLALLALRPRPRPREIIAADLWPDAGPGVGASLRQALWLVRSSLTAAGLDPEKYLESDADSIGLRAGAPVVTDVGRFDALLAGSPPRLDEAIALYGGDLAEGHFNECFCLERERLSDAYEDALGHLAEHRSLLGDLAGAEVAARRLIERDPLREDAHAVLMSVFAATGSRIQVARQFRRLRSILERELGVEPLAETVAVYQAAMGWTAWRSQRNVGSALFGSAEPTPSLDRQPLWLVGRAS